MNNLLVSLNDNILKLTLFTDKGFSSYTSECGSDCVNGSIITNPDTFSQKLSKILYEEMHYNGKKPYIHFLVEPSDVILKFVTVSKKGGELEEQILADIKAKLEGVSIEDLYFSYQKIAPFVYQFVGVRKELLETYLKVSDILAFELRSIVPWLLLLPKYVNNSLPCIFVSKNQKDQVVALSELNGIYFSAVYENERPLEEVQKLVSELSVYKRSSPITKVYTIYSDSFTLGDAYEVVPIKISDVDPSAEANYPLHILFDRVFGLDPSLFFSQLNLINMFPVPTVERKNVSLVKVGAGIVAALLIVVVFAVASRGGKPENTNNESAMGQQQEVLSENSTNEATQSEVKPVESKPELKKSDLKVKIENGAGVPGVAAKAQTYLADLGYNVVEIGNSTEPNRTSTLVRFKKAKADYIPVLSEDLKKNYEISTEDSLKDTQPYDVLVVIGAK